MTTHRERLLACLHGDATERPPVALWRHFPVDDQSPKTLAAAHVTFQRTYDFDLVKVTPASSFCLKDWGVEDVWEGNTEGTRRYIKTVITRPEDWERLTALEPTAPHVAAQLECLRILRRELGPDTPILQTIFNPLAQARHLAGDQQLLFHLRMFPAALAKGLATIEETTKRFIKAAIQTGIDGVFYAVQHAQAGVLSRDEFERYSRRSDLAVLGAAAELWCNMLHLHGENVYFDAVADYPVQVINWHDRETAPSLAAARATYAGMLCGGLSRDTLVYGSPQDIQTQAADAIAQTRGRGLMLSTGCVVPIICPQGNLRAAAESIRHSG